MELNIEEYQFCSNNIFETIYFIKILQFVFVFRESI